MYTLSTLVVLVVVVVGQAAGAAGETPSTKVSSYFDDHTDRFLARMNSEFKHSLEYLSTAYAKQFVDRPGMFSLLKAESDRRWSNGVSTLKKYIQRGGTTNDSASVEPPLPPFRTSFQITARTMLSSLDRTDENYPTDYLAALRHLITDSKHSSLGLNVLHRMTMQRAHTRPDDYYGHYDADMAHYIEEQLEDEIKSMRKFSNHYTRLSQMVTSGLALHIFDESL